MPTPFGQFRLPMGERQVIRSRLHGPLSLQVVIDTQGLAEYTKQAQDALNKQAGQALLGLANVGVAMLREKYAAVGRKNLAPLWTNTPLKKLSEGVFETVIYNQIVFSKYMTPSNAPIKRGVRRTFPIKGALLLKLIEEGASPHTIEPRTAKSLQFMITRGISQSRFAGTAMTERGVAVGRFTGEASPGTRARFKRVSHPGIVGSRFVDLVASKLVSMAESKSEVK